jgi:uncharacterized membrane protein YfcA
MAMTVGTSLVIIVINSLAGLAAHLGEMHFDWAVIGAFAVAAMAASLLAGRFGRRLPEHVLKRGFAGLVLLVAAYVAIQAIAK